MILVVLLVLLLRVLAGLYGYSGQGKPPMFGDYEAQRHWMEITYNLPVGEWYHNTTDNDLMYWGLDYPPLTAYHSWACGAVADIVNPQFVKLGESRGYESSEHKSFMRYTVLLADILTYFVPVLLLASTSKAGLLAGKLDLNITGFVLLAYPGLILIDHGHFQYNCVSLGLVLTSLWSLTGNKDTLSAVTFCLALNYKQMTLYYALPIFAYFLRKCGSEFTQKGAAGVCAKFINLSVTVLLTFAVIWSPFATHTDGVLQVLHRLFPIDRGIFEDKVSNFWCVLNVFFKVRDHFTNQQTALLSAILTFIAAAPSCAHVLYKGDSKTLLYCLFNCSLGFFMFSFQVHEKSILLVALPALLLFEKERFHSFWFLTISTFSMLPLLLKDQLIIPYIALTSFFSLSVSLICGTKNIDFFERHKFPKWLSIFFKTSMLGMLLLTVSTVTLKPPSKYPDLFPLLISSYSAAHFAYFFLYFHYAQFTSSGKIKSI
ncbi:hypothetical protein GE061_008381 [Apolygus lucorum]|uniref:Alpha-1,3-glucosyltransferase n=1 Tax=Apolygus lucorum TaxID=248454 RepID=A0A6A4J0A2_APOLU|nr:hypothetical protein GE061_008381 [Apolygus lucorum]